MNKNKIYIILLLGAAVAYLLFLINDLGDIKQRFTTPGDYPTIDSRESFLSALNSDTVGIYFVKAGPVDGLPIDHRRKEIRTDAPLLFLRVKTYEMVRGEYVGLHEKNTDHVEYFSPRLLIFDDYELQLNGCASFNDFHVDYHIDEFIAPDCIEDYSSQHFKYYESTSKWYYYDYIKKGDPLFFMAKIGCGQLEICKAISTAPLISTEEDDFNDTYNVFIMVCALICVSIPFAVVGYLIYRIVSKKE